MIPLTSLSLNLGGLYSPMSSVSSTVAPFGLRSSSCPAYECTGFGRLRPDIALLCV